jgi:endonuclease/exonuclease/phosphatase family metal-dependent hydrolase
MAVDRTSSLGADRARRLSTFLSSAPDRRDLSAFSSPWSSRDRLERRPKEHPRVAPASTPDWAHPSTPTQNGEVMIASYNVENLFDTVKDPSTKDEQFFPEGQYNWTEPKLAKKIENLGKAIRSMNGGKGPDILAMNEVEHAAIVKRLRDDALSDLGYETVVHLDTEDKRGIDNAILSRYPQIGSAKLHTVHHPDDPLWKEEKTRGILEATFDVKGVPLTVFVNHWPASDWGKRREQRQDVARQLREIISAKLAEDPDREILVLGDFNASPGEAAFGKDGLAATGDRDAVRDKKPGAVVYNTIACLAEQLALESKEKRYDDLGEVEKLLKDHGDRIGTHYDPSKKRWNGFDQIFVSRGLLDKKGLSWREGSTQIHRSPFLIDPDGHPRSTFDEALPYAKQTPEKIGISDHLPLVARLVHHP